MNILTYLNNLRPAIPYSSEKPCSLMSQSELRRHINSGVVLINHERVTWDEELDYPVMSLVFFPNSKKRRTTLV